MLARYFMYSQVYFHHIRRVYDIHLKDFLKEWLENGGFSTDTNKHITTTDNEVTAALLSAAYDENKPGHAHAHRIICREHFKEAYQRNPNDVKVNREAGELIYNKAKEKFGSDCLRHDYYSQKGGTHDFPVRRRDGEIVSSSAVSTTLQNLPVVAVDSIFADNKILSDVKKWIG
jgi:uncharacterized protein